MGPHRPDNPAGIDLPEPAAANPGLGWTVLARLAVEAAGEPEARAILDDILAEMDVVLEAEPVAGPFGDRFWVLEAELDMSGLESAEPDDAVTRISYVTRNLTGLTWLNRARPGERDGSLAWPPGFWAMSGREEALVHPAVRAAVMSLRGDLAAPDELARVRDELAGARERIAELEERLAKTSRNSGKPPSSDGLGKPPPKPQSLRKKSGRKPGGQDGHEGRTLAQVAKPRHERVHEPVSCGKCGAGLAGAPVTDVERRQVSGMPPASAPARSQRIAAPV
jgi:hypothetical protein